MDFLVDERISLSDGKCLMEVPLTEYAIAEVRTGQLAHVDGGYNHLCVGQIRLDE